MKKYCAICGSVHDEDVPCLNASAQTDRDMRGARGGSGGPGLPLRTLLFWIIGLVLFIAAGWFVFRLGLR